MSALVPIFTFNHLSKLTMPKPLPDETTSAQALPDEAEPPPTHDPARGAILFGAILFGASRQKRRKVAALPPGLKAPTRGMPGWPGRSDALSLSMVPSREAVRATYLERFADARAPVVSTSPFVPRAMVAHLMRNKRDSAIGVKFLPGRADAVTLMEGAMHTFVTLVVRILMHCDYVWAPGHAVVRFGTHEGKQVARPVVLSASVHPDFETPYVMQRLAALADETFYGKTFGLKRFKPLGVADKQDDTKRTQYDAKLKQHMVAHLVHYAQLPPRAAVREAALSERRSCFGRKNNRRPNIAAHAAVQHVSARRSEANRLAGVAVQYLHPYGAQ